MASDVRIIGGKWKGRKVRFESAAGLRPSLGRVRETLFNWLNQDITGQHCLDLFAGSGALGFEALSRGASDVVFVDLNPRVCRSLRNQLDALNTQMPVYRADAAAFLRRHARHGTAEPGRQFDLIFADPPFDTDQLTRILQLVQERNLLSADGRLYYECRRGSDTNWPDWTSEKHSRAGDTQFGLLARES